MKAPEAERSSLELPATSGIANEESSQAQAQVKPAPAYANGMPIQRKPLAAPSRLDWPLPPPIEEVSSENPATLRRKPQSERIVLSQEDQDTLTALHERCKAFGIKIKKDKLLAAGLQLLAGAPPGKLLAILGPLESHGDVLKRKKKKPPLRP